MQVLLYDFLLPCVAAFIGVIPPGLINLSVGKSAFLYGNHLAKYELSGVLLITFLQGIIASGLASVYPLTPALRSALLSLALFFLIGLVIYFIITIINDQKQNPVLFANNTSNGMPLKKAIPSKKKLFYKGLGIASMNILPIPYFWVLNAIADTQIHVSYTMLLFSMGVALGTFLILKIYMYIFNYFEQKIETYLPYFNWAMLLVLSISLGITFVRIFAIQ